MMHRPKSCNKLKSTTYNQQTVLQVCMWYKVHKVLPKPKSILGGSSDITLVHVSNYPGINSKRKCRPKQ